MSHQLDLKFDITFYPTLWYIVGLIYDLEGQVKIQLLECEVKKVLIGSALDILLIVCVKPS